MHLSYLREELPVAIQAGLLESTMPHKTINAHGLLGKNIPKYLAMEFLNKAKDGLTRPQSPQQSDTDSPQSPQQSDTDSPQSPQQSDTDSPQSPQQSDTDSPQSPQQSDTDSPQSPQQSDMDSP
ncbi:sporozoite surface protein 2-like [Branchiostoma floridae]|uniref:Sporozoite surface protein 2-like n=1 Tax=Branchiostoma floridae TaxID=7739 RepID=A0A9J7LDV2_BRAFL|nr:sporozoite surface protein 2-like [Branchiostoma floridae]